MHGRSYAVLQLDVIAAVIVAVIIVIIIVIILIVVKIVAVLVDAVMQYCSSRRSSADLGSNDYM